MALLVVVIGIFANTSFFKNNIQNGKQNIFSILNTSKIKEITRKKKI